MTIEGHLAALKEKHAALEAEIEKALQSPATDPLHIAELKKRKLQIKEEIERLSQKAE